MPPDSLAPLPDELAEFLEPTAQSASHGFYRNKVTGRTHFALTPSREASEVEAKQLGYPWLQIVPAPQSNVGFDPFTPLPEQPTPQGLPFDFPGNGWSDGTFWSDGLGFAD